MSREHLLKDQLWCQKVPNIQGIRPSVMIIIMIMYISKKFIALYTKDIQKQINKQRGILCITVKFFLTSFTFYANRIITSSLNSMISANHDKEQGSQRIVKSLYYLMFLQFRISYFLHFMLTSNCKVSLLMPFLQIGLILGLF